MTRQAKTPLKADPACVVPQAPPRAPTRTTTLIGLMRAEGGASAADHRRRGGVAGAFCSRVHIRDSEEARRP